MPTTWKDLYSKNEDFNKFLPKFNGKSLVDGVNMDVTAKASDAKFDFKVKKADESVNTSFDAKVEFPEYKGAEFELSVKNKPHAEISVKLDDHLLPLEGSKLKFKVAGSKKSEIFGMDFGYKTKSLDFNFGLSAPLFTKIYDFVGDAEEDNKKIQAENVRFHGDFLLKPFEERDYFVGAQLNTNVPREGHVPSFNAKFAVAVRDSDFEGGLYVKSGNDSGKTNESGDPALQSKVGMWAATSKDDVVIKSSFHKAIGSKEGFNGIEIDAGVSTENKWSKLLLQLAVVPHNVLSVGYERCLSDNTKLIFGYSHVLAFSGESEKQKKCAYNFGIKISH